MDAAISSSGPNEWLQSCRLGRSAHDSSKSAGCVHVIGRRRRRSPAGIGWPAGHGRIQGVETFLQRPDDGRVLRPCRRLAWRFAVAAASMTLASMAKPSPPTKPACVHA
jgi:hypothetical protein